MVSQFMLKSTAFKVKGATLLILEPANIAYRPDCGNYFFQYLVVMGSMTYSYKILYKTLFYP